MRAESALSGGGFAALRTKGQDANAIGDGVLIGMASGAAGGAIAGGFVGNLGASNFQNALRGFVGGVLSGGASGFIGAYLTTRNIDQALQAAPASAREVKK